MPRTTPSSFVGSPSNDRKFLPLKAIGAIADSIEGCECGGNRPRPEHIEYRAVFTLAHPIGDARRGLAPRMHALGNQPFAHKDEAAGPPREFKPGHPIQVGLKAGRKAEIG